MKPKRKKPHRYGPVFPNKPPRPTIVPKRTGLWDVPDAETITQQAIESRSDLEKAWAKDDDGGQDTSQAGR